MKKLGIIWLLSLTVISISFCRKDVNGISEPDQERTIDWVIQNRQQDLVAAVAVFEKKPHQTRRDHKLIVFDYYNPQNYKILTDSTYSVTNPKFSPNKRKILFGDHNFYWEDLGPTLRIYDLLTGNTDSVYDPRLFEGLYPLAGYPLFWDAEGNGFYLTYVSAFFADYIRYYSLLSGEGHTVAGSGNYDVNAHDIIPPDTLIIKTANPAAPDGTGYYFMDTNGNYLERIKFEKLNEQYNITEIGGIKYNSRIGKFFFFELYILPAGNKGSKISTVNRDMTGYENHTPGNGYHEVGYSWNIKENSIIYSKIIDYHSTKLISGVLMVFNMQTNEIESLFTPSFIPNCILLYDADF